MRTVAAKISLRGHLHVSDSMYNSSYDVMHDFHEPHTSRQCFDLVRGSLCNLASGDTAMRVFGNRNTMTFLIDLSRDSSPMSGTN